MSLCDHPYKIQSPFAMMKAFTLMLLVLLLCLQFFDGNTFHLATLWRGHCSNLHTVHMAGGFGKATSTKKIPSQSPSTPSSHSSGPNSAFNPVSSDRLPALPASKLNMTNYVKGFDFDTHYPGLRVLSLEPPVFEIMDFFTAEECDSYIKLSQEKGKEIASKTFSPLTAGSRTSTTWYLFYKDVPELLQRAKQLSGLPLDHFEEPQVVRYELGQQFTWHYDAIPTELVPLSGQRLMTLLVYLNDVPSGGATCFKELQIKVQPKKGKALVFFPCFAQGQSDERTLHAGQVALNEKWIAQMWLHDRPYSPSVPEGNAFPLHL